MLVPVICYLLFIYLCSFISYWSFIYFVHCSIIILLFSFSSILCLIHRLNFERLNFERPNFVWLNFERPNFERLNFERLNFERPNFEWLNFEMDRTFHDRTSNRTELRKIFSGSLKILQAITNTVYTYLYFKKFQSFKFIFKMHDFSMHDFSSHRYISFKINKF
jgi:hypothetical protein